MRRFDVQNLWPGGSTSVEFVFALKRKLAVLWLLAGGLTATAAEPAFWSWAKTPPMGWNCWDCYGAGVRESNVIANADYMAQHPKPHGWDAVTIDIQWYEPLTHTTEYRRGAMLEMAANGRLLPRFGISGTIKTSALPMTLSSSASTLTGRAFTGSSLSNSIQPQCPSRTHTL